MVLYLKEIRERYAPFLTEEIKFKRKMIHLQSSHVFYKEFFFIGIYSQARSGKRNIVVHPGHIENLLKHLLYKRDSLVSCTATNNLNYVL